MLGLVLNHFALDKYDKEQAEDMLVSLRLALPEAVVLFALERGKFLSLHDVETLLENQGVLA